jgi:hypothetical protein
MKIQNSICGDTINQLNNILKDMSVININDFDIR